MSDQVTPTAVDPLLESQDGPVAVVQFNEPETRNAWHPGLDVAFSDALDRLERDPSVRAVIVCGTDGQFCPGRRMSGLSSIARGAAPRAQSTGIDRARTFRKPLIAVIEGGCAGIGLTLALLCDVRFAASTARFSTAFSKRGLAAGHATGWLLQRTVGHAHATELLLSARVLDGEEAQRLGLVHRSIPENRLRNEARRYAHDLAGSVSPRSVSVIKEQLAADLESSYEDALDRARVLADEAFLSPDFTEGVASYRARRAAHFPPLAMVTDGVPRGRPDADV